MLIGMGTPIQTLPISAAALREVDLKGVFRYANAYPEAVELIKKARASGVLDLNGLITNRFFGFENIERAFDVAARTKDDPGNVIVKVVIQFQPKHIE
jgi:L-iditol 2-dehydrogenase